MRNISAGRALKGIGAGLVLAATLGIALPAFADPPAHAPAHGWRKKHDPYYVGYTGYSWPQHYGVIDGRCNRDQVGAVLGGVVGGVVGSQIGDGSGRVIATVLGTVLGAVIGREIGRDMDERDRACTGHALELAKDGQSVRWLNDSTGVNYVLTPTGVYPSRSTCRTFELQASRNGRVSKSESVACRSDDGTWKFLKTDPRIASGR